MRKSKKGQMGPRELVITLVIAGVLFIVGILVFSKVSNTTDNLIDPTQIRTLNESLTPAMNDGATNSSLLTESGFIVDGLERVALASDQDAVLTADSNYTLTAQNGGSGALVTRANFTLLTLGLNNTALKVSYNRNIESSAQATVDVVNTTVLDSFELGVIALIVLAAVVILGVLFALQG